MKRVIFQVTTLLFLFCLNSGLMAQKSSSGFIHFKESDENHSYYQVDMSLFRSDEAKALFIEQIFENTVLKIAETRISEGFLLIYTERSVSRKTASAEAKRLKESTLIKLAKLTSEEKEYLQSAINKFGIQQGVSK